MIPVPRPVSHFRDTKSQGNAELATCSGHVLTIVQSIADRLTDQWIGRSEDVRIEDDSSPWWRSFWNGLLSLITFLYLKRTQRSTDGLEPGEHATDN